MKNPGLCRFDLGEQVANFGVNFGETFRIDAVDLGDADRATWDAQNIKDGKVLARLRHRPIIGRDDQEREINSGDAGQHVAHEALMPRHIDEADC